MIPSSSVRSRQPHREPWSREKLYHERAIALGQCVDFGTWKLYGSALNSYLNFVHIHNMPVEPTEDTLSLYVVFQCSVNKPDSVDSYLSGICHQLEPYFPTIRQMRKSPLVHRTLQGCMRLRGSPIKRKRALTLDDLSIVIAHTNHDSFDDCLFLAMILTGFFALLRLGEMAFPDDKSLHNWQKVTRRSTVVISDTAYQFLLPAHKADRFFEGNTIIVKRRQFAHNPLCHFDHYLRLRDARFPLASPLWITSAGKVPTRSFFMSHLRTFFDKGVAGQSMRAGGATLLAEHGAASILIQHSGRWTSDSFLAYVRKNPGLMSSLIFPQLA